MRFLVAAVMAIVAGGCAMRPAHPRPDTAAAPSEGPDFIDLAPGWRLRLTSPLLSRGVSRLALRTEADPAGGTQTATAAGLEGYEVSHYAIRESGGRLRFELVSSEAYREGQKTEQRSPRLALASLPRSASFARLLHLRRLSASDHDMALIAARRKADLEAFSRRLMAEPEACRKGRATFCVWMPEGTALVAERFVQETKEWRPVQ